MNPTIPEETGQTIRTLAEKLNPATLALIIANIGMLVFIFYALSQAAGFRDNMIKGQVEYQLHVTELLSRCVVPFAPGK